MGAITRSLLGVPIKPSGQQAAPDTVDEYVAARLRTKRRELKISREAAARALKVSVAQFDRLERGLVRIKARQIERLCALLEVTPSYFFLGLLPGVGSPYVPSIEKPEEDQMLARSLALAAAVTFAASTVHAEVQE